MTTASRETGPPSPPLDDASLRPSDRASVGGLVWTLVRTDFKARYHGTVSGFVWALLKPALMFLVLVAVFSLVFRAEPNYKLNLIIGLFLWDFFSESTRTGMISLHAKGFLLTKARFPRWVVVVTSVANAMITLTVFVGVVLLYLLADGRLPSFPSLLAFGAVLLALVAIAIGLSLGSSVLFLRFRDLNQIWDMTIQAGFFVAPIIWPLSVVPERFHLLLYLWPPTPIVEFSRAALVFDQPPTVRGGVFLLVMAAGVLAAGSVVFHRFAPAAAEYV